MTDVFISYSHKDGDYAHRLADELKLHQIGVWIDDRINYGDMWMRIIEENLIACQAFIVIMSNNARNSDWVQNEMTYAQQKKKIIFPLLLEGEVWLSTAAKQYVDVRTGKMPPVSFFEDVRNSLSQSILGERDKKSIEATEKQSIQNIEEERKTKEEEERKPKIETGLKTEEGILVKQVVDAVQKDDKFQAMELIDQLLKQAVDQSEGQRLVDFVNSKIDRFKIPDFEKNPHGSTVYRWFLSPPNKSPNKINMQPLKMATKKDIGRAAKKEEKLFLSEDASLRLPLMRRERGRISVTDRALIFWDKVNANHSFEISSEALARTKVETKQTRHGTELSIALSSGVRYVVELQQRGFGTKFKEAIKTITKKS